MPDTTRLTPLPAIRRTAGQAQQEAVVARPVNSLGGLPSASQELQGLLQGLASFSPGLEGLQHDAKLAQHQKDLEGAHMARVDAAAAVGRMSSAEVADAASGAPLNVPYALPAAHGQVFNESYQKTLADRAALLIKQDAIKDWHNKRNDPEFDAATWMETTRQKALAGNQDPTFVAAIGAHMTNLQAELAGEAERARVVRMDASSAENLSVSTQALLAGAKTTEDVQSAFTQLQAQHGSQHPPGVIAKGLFEKVHALSQVRGGDPSLFDALLAKGPNGEPSVVDKMPPGTEAHVMVAREQAVEKKRQATIAAAQPHNGNVGRHFETLLETDPLSITQDFIVGHSGPEGYFNTAHSQAAAWGRVLDAQKKANAAKALDGAWDAGHIGARLDAGVQNKLMDSKLSGVMEAVLAATDKGDIKGAAQAAASIFQVQSSKGSSIAWDRMKGYIEGLASNLQAGDAPSAKFLIAAELYKSLGGNEQYRSLYFKDDVNKVLRSYTSTVASNDPAEQARAYQAAYAANDPVNIARAHEWAKSAEGKKAIDDKLGKLVGGTSWAAHIPGLGAWFRPEENSAIKADLQGAMRDFAMANPHLSDKALAERAAGWIAENYVHDKTTNRAIKVPRGMGGDEASAAITNYTKALADGFRVADRNDAKWAPLLSPAGDAAGTFQVHMANPSGGSSYLGTISIDKLMTMQTASKVFTADEAKQLGAVKEAYKKGTLLQVDAGLLAKAEALNVLDKGTAEAYRKQAVDAFAQRVASVPKMAFGDHAQAPLVARDRPGAYIDNGLTSRVAQSFLGGTGNGPSFMGADRNPHVNLAAALITVGEGVAVRPYADPAAGAGMNIGMGYNLKANAGNVDQDLKEAGLDQQAIAAVKAGTAALTPEQSKRLLMAALPRYEKQAQQAAEAATPGLWGRMTASQRAVMIDVAWQTGDPSKFKKAFAAIESGDAKAFEAETQVAYTSAKTGQRVVDTARAGHRAALLAGTGIFQARMGQLGQLPSNQLQALAPQ